MVIAVVFGSTGAVGKQLVIQASNNSAFEKVRVVLRRKIDYPDADKDKIVPKNSLFQGIPRNSRL